jgi:integrase
METTTHLDDWKRAESLLTAERRTLEMIAAGARLADVLESLCNAIDAPKSEASNARIAVNRSVIERIYRLKLLTVQVRAGRAIRKYRVVKTDKPEDLVFQSVRSGSPIRDNNVLCRFIKPVARELRMSWVNWRCLRTSHATWLKLAGGDVKDAQAQMRHSRASTTLDIYQQFVPESQQRVVERLSTLAPRRIM